MKAFEINQHVLCWLCIHPMDSDEEMVRIRKKRYLFTILLLMITAVGFISSFIYIYKFFFTDLEEALYAVFQAVALIGVTYFMIFAYILRKKIARIFIMFQNIYDDSKYKFHARCD